MVIARNVGRTSGSSICNAYQPTLTYIYMQIPINVLLKNLNLWMIYFIDIHFIF